MFDYILTVRSRLHLHIALILTKTSLHVNRSVRRIVFMSSDSSRSLTFFPSLADAAFRTLAEHRTPSPAQSRLSSSEIHTFPSLPNSSAKKKHAASKNVNPGIQAGNPPVIGRRVQQEIKTWTFLSR